MWIFIVIFAFLTGEHRAQAIFHHVCPDKHVVYQINSPTGKARQWKIECKAFGATSGCSWSRPQHLNDKQLSYICPANHVVAGVYSNNNNAHGDRSFEHLRCSWPTRNEGWRLLCCSAPNFITFECRKTPMVNYFNGDFNWQLPAGHFLTGVQTHHKINGDHHWSFNYCKGTTQDTRTANSQIHTANKPVENHLTKEHAFVRNKRNAKICEYCRWPKKNQKVIVPYIISNDFTPHEKEIIHSAIKEFNDTTCVRFVAHRQQTDYIIIVKTDNVCESVVGRRGGYQELSLSAGCIHIGNIQHEFIHALGFWHEQNRSDRDGYVEIKFENIKESQEKNFNKYKTNNLGVPYDLDSVMHYGRKTFSANNEDTIVPHNSSAQIGQREGMSEKDILKINKLYSCYNYQHKYGEWDNELNKAFCRMCPSGQAVSGISSIYNSEQKDRLWAFYCKAFKENKICKWSAYVNLYESNFKFKCEDNKVIAGACSSHSNPSQDRRWRFYCCHHTGFTTSNCLKTTKINNFKETFSWVAPSNNYLTGVESVFDDETCDREWTFTYCQGKTN